MPIVLCGIHLGARSAMSGLKFVLPFVSNSIHRGQAGRDRLSQQVSKKLSGCNSSNPVTGYRLSAVTCTAGSLMCTVLMLVVRQ
jgi:hypothetical protein